MLPDGLNKGGIILEESKGENKMKKWLRHRQFRIYGLTAATVIGAYIVYFLLWMLWKFVLFLPYIYWKQGIK